MNLADQQYIEHEIAIRVNKETADYRFLALENKLDDLREDMRAGFADIKKNMLWFVAICVSGFAIPVVLKILGVF